MNTPYKSLTAKGSGRIVKRVVASALIFCAAMGSAYADAVSDILVGYSASSASEDGGVSQFTANVYNQYAGANGIAYNSGSPHRQNVVGVMQSAVDCSGLTTDGGLVNWFSSDDSHVSDVVAYGNYLGADQITYIGDMSDDGSAAVAMQPGRYSCFQNAYFWYIIAAHESGGHNFNLDHNDAVNDPAKTVMLHNYCGGGAQPYYTNPNNWLNGVQLIGVGNCQGSPSYGGDDCYQLSLTAQGMSDSYDRLVFGSSRGPTVYRWEFNQPAASATAGTVITDQISGAQAIVRGQGALFTGTSLRLPGGTTGNVPANSVAAYVDLPNGIFSAMPNFTVELWATPQSYQNMERLIEIGSCSGTGAAISGSGEYVGSPGTPAPGATSAWTELGLSAASTSYDLNSQRLIVTMGGNVQLVDSNLSTTAGALHYYAVTFANTATGALVSWYRDGVFVNSIATTISAAQLQDVNNWIGRSVWSGDSMANMDVVDLRIQNIALNAGNVSANYLMGPDDAVRTMWANDSWGSSGFVSGAWEFSPTPDSSHDYDTDACRLIAPYDSTNDTFPGRSLRVSGGSLFLAAQASRTVTVNDLRLNGGTVAQMADGGSSDTQTLAGNITVQNATTNYIRGASGPLTISANISGFGGMMYTENNVTLSGSNLGYTGETQIGDGRFSTLTISSEANLGSNPPYFGGGWLVFDRGILATTQTMSISNANRGIRIGPSGGIFQPAAGTTLTINVPISSPAAGDTLQTSPMNSNPMVGILFQNGPGTTVLTNPYNSHNDSMQILAGELRLSGSGRINVGNHWMPITLNSLFTDSSSLNQTLSGAISGYGSIVQNGPSTLTIGGNNSFNGSVTVNGGCLYATTGNAANNNAFSYVSGIVVNGGTLESSVNALFGWDGSQVRPITINAGGTFMADGGSEGDVAVGTVTLNGGTMTSGSPCPTWGTFRFDNAASQLLVNANSTVSASNVKFGSSTASVNVAPGVTLNFPGTITNASSGGISYLNKIGAGTLLLSGSNNYSGATAISAGTLNLLGSLSGSSAVTVYPGAVLTGTGNIAGGLSFSGAVHSPGNPIGTETVAGALSYDGSSRLEWSLFSNSNAGGVAGQVSAGALTVASGAKIDLVMNGSGSAVNFTNSFWSSSHTWTVIYSSGMTGSFSLGNISSDAVGHSASTYGNFSLVQTSAGVTLQWVATPLVLPSGWNGFDVGNPAISGASGANGGTYTVVGSGADISGTADQFQFASNTLTGDGEIRARVTSQTNTNSLAKAGVMIRSGSSAGAVDSLVAITPGSGFVFQVRTGTNGTTTSATGPALNTPPNNWVRLTRSGSLITAYVSASGTSWTQIGTATLSLPSTTIVGLAVTSRNNSTTSTATFDNVSITPFPSPWISADIGTSGTAGSAEYYPTAFTLKGAGAFGGTSDAFHFVYQTLSGDGSIIARVGTLQNTGVNARVGVMMRDTLVNNARMAALNVNGSGVWYWERRTVAGNTVTQTTSSSGTAPNLWVKLTRSGSTFTAYRSTNGTSWTSIGSASVTMATNCYFGLSVTSGSTSGLNTSVIDNVTASP